MSESVEVVYFIRESWSGAVKIGSTTHDRLAKRLAELQTGCPHKLVVARLFAGGRELERVLHDAFSHEQIRGEWFMPQAGGELDAIVGDRIIGCTDPDTVPLEVWWSMQWGQVAA